MLRKEEGERKTAKKKESERDKSIYRVKKTGDIRSHSQAKPPIHRFVFFFLSSPEFARAACISQARPPSGFPLVNVYATVQTGPQVAS